MKYNEVIKRLEALADPKNVEGMARFGISPEKTLGVSVKSLRALAKEIGRDHDLAASLWESGIHEARLLATLTDVPAEVTEEQAESWVADLDSWDICDGLCFNLLWRTPFAWDKPFEWSKRREEFVKRAAFALMAKLTLSDKKAPDERVAAFLPLIERQATDERNFVKKAVNWALRQIGKRSLTLNAQALATARRIQSLDSKTARWIAADAIRELQSEAVRTRLEAKG